MRNTVVRATHTVNGRLGNSTTRGSKTPEPIEMKLYMVDYVTHPLLQFQWNHHISVMAQDKIFKFDLLSEINWPMWFTKFDP